MHREYLHMNRDRGRENSNRVTYICVFIIITWLVRTSILAVSRSSHLQSQIAHREMKMNKSSSINVSMISRRPTTTDEELEYLQGNGYSRLSLGLSIVLQTDRFIAFLHHYYGRNFLIEEREREIHKMRLN